MAKYSWPETPVLLSTDVKRLDGPEKVTGRAAAEAVAQMKFCLSFAETTSPLRVSSAPSAQAIVSQPRSGESGLHTTPIMHGEPPWTQTQQ